MDDRKKSPELKSDSSDSADETDPSRNNGCSNYVMYRDRPEWKDVQPVAQDDGPAQVVRIAYSEKCNLDDVLLIFLVVVSNDQYFLYSHIGIPWYWLVNRVGICLRYIVAPGQP
jgi:protein farnesyltransferase/geranylgeranyltransferase type-1 subunit alpha